MKTISGTAVCCALLVALFATSVVAQQPCVVLPAPAENYAFAPPAAPLDPSCTVTFPVALWIVRTDDGVTSTTDAMARAILDRLNDDFYDHNIQFEEYDLDYIDNTDWLVVLDSAEFETAASQVMGSNSVLNILFVNGLWKQSHGLAYLGGRVMAIVRDMIATSVATHEAGHMLFLMHTHGSDSHHNERVRRSGTGVNCTTEGDGFCDTPAEPWNNGDGLKGLVDGNCNYTGGTTYKDDMNDVYTPNTHNYMSYTQTICRDEFSSEQVAAMRAHIGTNAIKRAMLTPITVTFDNKIGGSSAGGGIHVQTAYGYSESYTSLPHSELFSPCSMIEEYTMQDRLPVSTETHKHNNWVGDLNWYKMFQSYNIPSSAPDDIDMDANFEAMQEVSFGTHFEDGSAAIDFDFRDPWYVESGVYDQSDEYATVSNGFTPTGHWNKQEGGLMKEMGYDPSNSTHPYYAMKVPRVLDAQKTLKNPATLAQGDWICYGIFSDDEGGMTASRAGDNTSYYTRSISLQPSSTTTAVGAEYKGHRMSYSGSSPTNLNSQRKVAFESARSGSSATQHAVYESNGKIFYMRSTDNGTNWATEQLVSSFYTTASMPSIATSYNGWVDTYVGGEMPEKTYLMIIRRCSGMLPGRDK